MGLLKIIKNLFSANSVSGKSQSPSVRTDNQHELSIDPPGDRSFIFRLEQERGYEIDKCEVGDHVVLWMPENNFEFVMVYRGDNEKDRGGQIGMVPDRFITQFADHYQSGFEYKANVVSLNPCKIQCTLLDRSKTIERYEKHQAEATDKAHSELSKPYRPNKDIKITVEPFKGKAKFFKPGFNLYLKQNTLDDYLENASRLTLTFLNDEGQQVAEKWRVPQHVKSIIRAQLSGYKIGFKVIGKAPKDPGQYHVQVTYHPK